MYEHNRAKCYSQLRNLISEDDIIKCIHLVNKIKEHSHNKIKSKHIDKFKHLVRKSSVYLYNFGRFGGHIPLSRHPQNTVNNHPKHSNSDIAITALLTVAMAAAAAPTNTYSTQCNGTINHQTKVGYKPFQHPLTSAQESLLSRGPNFAIIPKYPPRRLMWQQLRRPVPDSLPERQEFRSNSSCLLNNHSPPANLTSQWKNTEP